MTTQHPRRRARLAPRTLIAILTVMMAALGFAACESDEVSDRYATRPYGLGAGEEAPIERDEQAATDPRGGATGGLSLEESRALYGDGEARTGVDTHLQPNDPDQPYIEEPEWMQEMGEPFDKRARAGGDLFDEGELMVEDEALPPEAREGDEPDAAGAVPSEAGAAAQPDPTLDRRTPPDDAVVVEESPPTSPERDAAIGAEREDQAPSPVLEADEAPLAAEDDPARLEWDTAPVVTGDDEAVSDELEADEAPIAEDEITAQPAPDAAMPEAMPETDEPQARRPETAPGTASQAGMGACEAGLAPEITLAGEIDVGMLGSKQPIELRITAPQPGAVIEDDVLAVEVALEGYATEPDGRHVHVIIDNLPYEAYYRAESQAFELDLAKLDLEPGPHTIRAFPSRPWHESIKDPGAFATTWFYYQEETGEAPTQLLEGPLLTYSRPKGVNDVTPQDNRVLLDFWVSNTTLGADGHQVRVTLDGGAPILVSAWMPIWLEGLDAGEHRIELELVDADGNVVPGEYNTTERTFTVRSTTDTAMVEEPEPE